MHSEKPSDWPLRIAGNDLRRDFAEAPPTLRPDIALAAYLDRQKRLREASTAPSGTAAVLVRLIAPLGRAGRAAAEALRGHSDAGRPAASQEPTT